MFGFDEPWQVLWSGSLLARTDTLLLVDIAEADVATLCDPYGETSQHALEAGSWLVAVSDKCELSLAPGAAYKSVPASSLCPLLAFVDAARAHNGRDQGPASGGKEVLVSLPQAACESDKAFERWLIRQSLSSPRGPLLHWLRTQEAYLLVRYLVDNYCSSGQLKSLCEKYGVSYSYFRKLCRDFLGMPAKAKLREWRAAKSVLDIVEGRGSILEVALNNGYSSASHIANDIRREFGITPTAFAKAEQLLLLKRHDDEC